MERLKGFEPLTRSLEGCCSIHLSHRRIRDEFSDDSCDTVSQKTLDFGQEFFQEPLRLLRKFLSGLGVAYQHPIAILGKVLVWLLGFYPCPGILL